MAAASPAARRWTLVATILGSSLTFIDGTVVNVALPALQSSLHATITDVQWVIEAYALFLGALILVGGSSGDQFGRKRTFLAGVVVFTAASAACGFADTVGALITARAIQGVGAAFLVPGSLAIIRATFEGADEGRAIGTWSGFSAITTALGPVAGGWLIEHVSWRAVFFLNLPLAAAVVCLSLRFMSESRDTSRTSRSDWTGAALAIAGLAGVVFALLEWPRAGIGRGIVIAPLAVGVASLAALVLVERRVAAPMLPLALFESRTFTLANMLTLFLYGALSVVFWLVPLELIQVQHDTATAVGAALLPFPLLMFALSRWSGGLVTRAGSRPPLTIGPLIAAAGMALFARAGGDGGYWQTIFPAVAVLGLGMAVTVAPLTTTAITAVEAHHAGVASGVNNAVSRIAGLIAIAVFGVLLMRVFDARAASALDRLDLPAAARGSVDRELPRLAGADVPADVKPAQREAVRQAIDRSFVSAFRIVMLAAAAVTLCAAGAGLNLRDSEISVSPHAGFR
jgi:EmrB/QacA subfamily drug resistance transporter